MLKNLGISAPLVESRPLFYDAAVDNAKNSDATELHVGARRGKAAYPSRAWVPRKIQRMVTRSFSATVFTTVMRRSGKDRSSPRAQP